MKAREGCEKPCITMNPIPNWYWAFSCSFTTQLLTTWFLQRLLFPFWVFRFPLCFCWTSPCSPWSSHVSSGLWRASLSYLHLSALGPQLSWFWFAGTWRIHFWQDFLLRWLMSRLRYRVRGTRFLRSPRGTSCRGKHRSSRSSCSIRWSSCSSATPGSWAFDCFPFHYSRRETSLITI